MGLFHDAVYADATVKGHKSYTKLDDEGPVRWQQQEPKFVPQGKSPQLAGKVYQDSEYVHMAYCNGQCGDQCTRSSINFQIKNLLQAEGSVYYDGQDEMLPVYCEAQTIY